ncbi:MAG: AbrB/MazE/SpoVT family DNA-binding domain-containing protein [Victivallales bacterium]|jgi:AbrB family looped-hinge helix DNA binding protein
MNKFFGYLIYNYIHIKYAYILMEADMNAIVAERGQVTIPKLLRLRFGIRPGTVLDFREENGKIVAVKEGKKDAVAAVRGCLKSKKRTDEIIRKMRD